MEELVALCKRRGFIFQSNEIYGGLQGLYDYGPLGVELKNNLKQAWWRSMVFDRDDVEGLDAQLIMGIDETKVILPNFIIFEDYNLVQNKKDEIYSWLHKKGYNTYSEGGICEAIKY